MVERYYNLLSELRIWEIVQNYTYEPIIENLDFTCIGLTSEPPQYGLKGVKLYADYTFNGELVVRKEFTYLENGLQIKFIWYKYDDTEGLVKIEFKPLSLIEIAKINKANRERTIIYLQESAKGTPIEQYVNELLRHYKDKVDLFIYNDTNDFYNAIVNEKEEPYNSYLNIVVHQSGKTTKDSIIESITGIPWN